MKSLIVYAHPWDGSFNHHILEITKDALSKKGNEVDVIDLHEDKFNPVFSKEGLKLFSKGEYHDPQAADYAKRLKASDEVIFIFPIWWYGVPAILKGFFDKVFLNGHTYDQDNKGEMTGRLKTKNAIALTTANIDEYTLTNFLGNPIDTQYLNGIMKLCGAEETKWIHCATVQDPESREKFVERIHEYFE